MQAHSASGRAHSLRARLAKPEGCSAHMSEEILPKMLVSVLQPSRLEDASGKLGMSGVYRRLYVCVLSKTSRETESGKGWESFKKSSFATEIRCRKFAPI
eukprot:116520_1